MFDIMDWYWQIDGNAEQVWSSRRFIYVALDDAEYLVFLEDATKNLTFTTQDDLVHSMLTRVVPQLLLLGVTINDVTYAIDEIFVAQMSRAVQDYAAGFGFPLSQDFKHFDINGLQVSHNPDDLRQLYLVIRDYAASLSNAIADRARGNFSELPVQPITY